jgi:glucosyl-3-phosphoglycerate synthase
MLVKHKNYNDFSSLLDRPLKKHGKKISLILPARDEHRTIGGYFPAFAELMENGCIDEIVVADNSDDFRTIDAALESAMSTEPFRSRMVDAIDNGGTLPVKAVSVFDPGIAGIFNGHKPKRGVPPGKGTAMYMGMAVATGDILLFLDTDFDNIDPRFVYGLAGPFENRHTVLSKATFEIEDTYDTVVEACRQQGRNIDDCTLLTKSAVTRTLAKPLTGLLDEDLGFFPTISAFNGPLSGGCGAYRSAWHSLLVPVHYGIDISYLMQFVRAFDPAATAYDVNLGEVVQESQGKGGLSNISKNIISTVMHHTSRFFPDSYDVLRRDPRGLVDDYRRRAETLAVHRDDRMHILDNAQLISDALGAATFQEMTLLPPLHRNLYYCERGEQVRESADESTYSRIELLERGVAENSIYQSLSVG